MSAKFDWTYPGLEWSRFHALATLLSMRNGGQAEPPFLPDKIADDDWSANEHENQDTESVDTSSPHQITDSGYGRLKRRFLDSLAEFAANKKGGAAVACTAMREGESSVEIWIARNEGFSDVDQFTFDRLGEMLASLFYGNSECRLPV